jgi:hypothetical protein
LSIFAPRHFAAEWNFANVSWEAITFSLAVHPAISRIFVRCDYDMLVSDPVQMKNMILSGILDRNQLVKSTAKRDRVS